MTAALLDHLWQSTLFGLGVWVIAQTLHANSAAVRHWLWLLASMKFLVPFSWLHGVGAALGATQTLEIQPVYAAALGSVASMTSPTAVLGGSPGISAPLLATLLIVAWTSGSLWLAARWFAGWRLARRLSKQARPAGDAHADVRLVDADIEPSVAHAFRPIVLLPSTLPGKLSTPQLHAVLEHEREHIGRRDILKANLHRLVETLFWFHPLVWFIGRRLVDERERACDEAVLARGHDAGEYAAGILEVCRHCRPHVSHAVAAVSGDLVQRVRHILLDYRPASLGFFKAFSLTAASLLLIALPLVAGALDGSAHRLDVAATNSRLLLESEVTVRASTDDSLPMSIDVSAGEVFIRSSSLRELIALAYEVETRHVKGRGTWLDEPRYDLTARLPRELREADDFDPAALRAMVNRLLAERFDLEIHVNQQCQDPCGPRALAVTTGR